MKLRVTRLNGDPAGYQTIIKLQDAIFEQRRTNLIGDTMLLLQVILKHRCTVLMVYCDVPQDIASCVLFCPGKTASGNATI